MFAWLSRSASPRKDSTTPSTTSWRADCDVLEDRTTPTVSSISGNFNGTAIPAGDSLWFSSVAKIQNMPASGTTIDVTNQTISFTAAGVQYSFAVPNSTITLSPSNTDTTLTTDSSGNLSVNSPTNFPGNVFLAGAPVALPSGLPGGVKNVTWSADFTTSTPGVRVQWQWAAAAYSQLAGTDSALNIKPTDGKTVADPNSDHAGTPEAFKAFVVGGATGGGGSNWTGSLSATVAVNPGAIPPPVQSPVTISGFVLTGGDGSPEVGVVVTLTGMTAQGPVTFTTTTDSTGEYSFGLLDNIPPGTYTVSEQPPLAPPGEFYNGTNSFAGQIDGSGAFGNPNGDTISSITLNPGDVGTQFNFINNYATLN
jgi:hypothetical protein